MFLRNHHPSLRLTLLSFLIGLLLLTVGSLAGVAYITGSRSIEEMEARFFQLASLAVGGQVTSFLEPALPILEESRVQAQRGRLPVNNLDVLGDYLIERLRYQKGLAWLSYAEHATGRFVGAWRRADGAVILNRSAPDVDGGRPREFEVTLDGRYVPFYREVRGGYDPRQQPWYRQAVTNAGVIWTEPFEFNEGVMGITAAVAVRQPGSAEPRGVFTADFFLDDVSRYLTNLTTTSRGPSLVVLFSRRGNVIASAQTWPQDDAQPLLRSALATLPEGPGELEVGQPVLTRFGHDSVPFVATFQAIEVAGGLEWVIAMLVPEDQFLQAVRDNQRFAAGLGIMLLGVAIVVGSLLAHRIATPLREIAADLVEVGRFKFSPRPSSPGFVQEIAVVSDTVERMKASLRSFGRYVPTELVQEVLASGREARLGGQNRTVTVHFSDIEGFTRISEHLEPGQVVEYLAEYLQEMTAILRAEQGTIDKFLGDGILAFFNAPRDVPDHVTRACRAALRSQQRLHQLRHDWKAAGRPAFRVRIGLHTGEVLVGNIGTPDRFEYTVIGDVVNLASRLEDLNKLYGTWILASQAVREQAGPEFEWRRLDCVAVVGREGGTPVYELLGERGCVESGVLQVRDLYEWALDTYFKRDFVAAAAGFRAAAAARPGDRAAEMLAGRAEAYYREPPPADWNGVYIQMTKLTQAAGAAAIYGSKGLARAAPFD